MNGSVTKEQLVELSKVNFIEIKKRQVYLKPMLKTKSAGLHPFEWTKPKSKQEAGWAKRKAHGRSRFQSLNFKHLGTLASGVSTKNARLCIAAKMVVI